MIFKKKRLSSFTQVPTFGYVFAHAYLCVEMYFDFYFMVNTLIVRGTEHFIETKEHLTAE